MFWYLIPDLQIPIIAGTHHMSIVPPQLHRRSDNQALPVNGSTSPFLFSCLISRVLQLWHQYTSLFTTFWETSFLYKVEKVCLNFECFLTVYFNELLVWNGLLALLTKERWMSMYIKVKIGALYLYSLRQLLQGAAGQLLRGKHLNDVFQMFVSL